MHLGRSCDFSIKTSIFKRYICICIHVFLKYDYSDISSSPTYTTSFGFLHSRLCHRARIDKRTHNISNISYRKNFRFCLLAARIEHLPCFVCLYLLYIFSSVRVRTYIYIYTQINVSTLNLIYASIDIHPHINYLPLSFWLFE